MKRITAVFYALILFCIAIAISADAATIKGTVKDAASNEHLVGTNVFLHGTGMGVAVDRDGQFAIRNVPGGDYKLVASYLGYEEFSKNITVSDSDVVEETITLSPSTIQGEEIVVGAMRQGQARALNTQRTASNIKNVVAADLIGRLPDLNTAEALQRIPSLSIQRDQGEGRYVLIRGTEARLNAVAINGDRLPSPEGDIRSVALDVIPSDVISTIEVNKALTPDMDGDAIGGSINMTTKSAFDYDKPIMKATVAGGYNEIMSDANFQGAFTYGRKLGEADKMGLMLGASYFRTYRGSDNIEMEWDTEDGADDQEYDVLANQELRDYEIMRFRLGLSADFDFKPNDTTKFQIKGIYNEFGDQEYRRRLRARYDKGDYTNLSNSGGSIEDGRFERELKDRYEVQRIYNISAKGEHELSLFDLDYKVAYSYAEEEEPDRHDITFELKDVNWDYHLADRDFPTYTITNDADIYDPAGYEFGDLVIEDNLTTEEDITAKMNLKMPVSFGSAQGEAKFGFKYKAKSKDRDNDVRIYELNEDYEDQISLADMIGDFEDDHFLDDRYTIGRSPDGDRVDEFIDNNMHMLELNEDDTRLDTDPANYEATENVLAGFAQAELNFGNFMLLPGFRYEMTDLEYTGNQVEINEDGDYAGTTQLTEEDDYANVLPMLHMRYKVNNRTNVRAAFTTSLARPNYYDLVPYRLVNREDEELEIGNPALDPTQSMNIDLFFEHYLKTLGSVTAGFFYKDLSDYIYNYVYDVEGSDYDGYEASQPQNGDNATLMGFEVAWQQQLTFLPGFWNGFGLNANYTYTDSEAEFPDREGEKATLPGQSTHMANVALFYEKFGFSSRLAWNYHGKYIDEVGEDETEDIYYDNHSQLDLSLSQQIKPGLKVFAEFANLTDAPMRYYQGKDNEDTHAIVQEYYSWWSHFGIKYDF